MPAYKRINQNTNSNTSNTYRSFGDLQPNTAQIENFKKPLPQQLPPQQLPPQQLPPQQLPPQQLPPQQLSPQQLPPQQEEKITGQNDIISEQFKHLEKINNSIESNEINKEVQKQQQEREEQINNIVKEDFDQPNLVQRTNFDNKLKQQQIREEMTEEIEKQLRHKLEQELREKYESEYNLNLNNQIENYKNEIKQNFKNEIEQNFKNNTEELEKERINYHKNITINDITEKYDNSNAIDGYHLLEVNRLLQSTPSLSFDQARSIANSNGCSEEGSNAVCPSKKIEHFQEKGNCVGGKCKVSFVDPDEEPNDNNDNSLISQIKNLDIEFYSNDRCGFCHRSKDLFLQEGVIDYMTIKENVPLPEGVEGFPHFVSNKTGNKHTGAPSSVESLINRLS